MGTTKAKLEAARQREKIDESPVFGLWTDARKSIVLRVTPMGTSARVRIVDVLDPSIIESICFFCGVTIPPRRSKWKNFDLVTNLTKDWDSECYSLGMVHLPRVSHPIGAVFRPTDKAAAQLQFFLQDARSTLFCTGSIVLKKEVRAAYPS